MLGSEKGLGVTHSDDLAYLFDGQAPDLRPGPDLKFSRRLVKLWVSFAKTGKPVATWGKEKNWEPISIMEAKSKRRLRWYVLNGDTSILKDPFYAKMFFWDDLMLKHPVASYPRTAKQEYRKLRRKKQQ
jgi:carboxylesterase type B